MVNFAELKNRKKETTPAEPEPKPKARVRDHDQVVVGIVMGSDTDLEIMQQAQVICRQFGVGTEMKVLSAHRTPEVTAEYARTAEKRGIKVIIAGAGGAAHLPGVIASYTNLPVIGVPIKSKLLHGLDSLLSIVQMPVGIPVATVGVGNARNAALLAIQILALSDEDLPYKLEQFRNRFVEEAVIKNQKIRRVIRRHHEM